MKNKNCKSYELDSRNPNIPLNKTAGRFYFEKFINNFNESKEIINMYKNLFGKNLGKLNHNGKKKIFKNFVCIINLETNSYCNRTCHYCPLATFKRKENHNIDNEIFLKILSELESIDYNSTICLNLYNEPLSDKDLFERISMIKKRLPKCFLRFNSNGDFIDISTLQKLESSGLDSLNITLHTTKINSYNDIWAKKVLGKFYSKLGLQTPQYTINPNQSITSSIYFGKCNMLVNTTNWDLYGNDRGGGNT
ncbi:hypothetical protein CCY99_09055 [Helicobacter sp. 16-1353]|uniref:radical SAM protein n=1 Tax=Helicobacter sp. 16-1353 TaxID=2004996 RepID=UPI000DCB0C8E|nr:radical SAM protein [Helicobacter sp. 16-1353]RAX51419.1 hypothetical protein CCY99_09055 [Helicobacter sp. 16-1353]